MQHLFLLLDAVSGALNLLIVHYVLFLIAGYATVSLVRRWFAIGLILVASVQNWDNFLAISAGKSLLRLLHMLSACLRIFAEN